MCKSRENGKFEELVQCVDGKAGHKVGIQTKISAISENNSSLKLNIFANSHCIIATHSLWCVQGAAFWIICFIYI